MSGISNWATDNYFDLLYTWLHLLYVYRIFSVVRNDLYLTYHMSVLNLCRLPKNTPHVFYRYKDWDFKWLSDARIWCFCLRHDLSFFFRKKVRSYRNGHSCGHRSARSLFPLFPNLRYFTLIAGVRLRSQITYFLRFCGFLLVLIRSVACICTTVCTRKRVCLQ